MKLNTVTRSVSEERPPSRPDAVRASCGAGFQPAGRLETRPTLVAATRRHLFPRIARTACRWVALAVALLALFAPTSMCLGLDDDQAVEAAREGLGKPVHYPWYDKQADDLRRIDVVPPSPPPKAGDWEWKEPTTPTPPRASAGFWEIVLEMLKYLAYGVMIAVLAGIVLLLVHAFLRSEAGAARTQQELATGTDDDIDRVEALPFQVRRGTGDLLAEARRYYEAGDYNEAIVYLYSYLLVELDKSQFIRLTRGKTNRQYLREVRRQPLMYNVLEMTMIAFEDVFFGRHALNRGRFEQCYDRLDEFEARIQEVTV